MQSSVSHNGVCRSSVLFVVAPFRKTFNETFNDFFNNRVVSG